MGLFDSFRRSRNEQRNVIQKKQVPVNEQAPQEVEPVTQEAAPVEASDVAAPEATSVAAEVSEASATPAVLAEPEPGASTAAETTQPNANEQEAPQTPVQEEVQATSPVSSTTQENAAEVADSSNGIVADADTDAITSSTSADAEEAVESEEMPLVKSTPIKTLAEKKPVEHSIGETKIIAIINQKGGVGKSTTAINLSASLGELDKAVLVIDLDPQGNTTSGLGVDKGQVIHDIYDVLLGELPIEETIIPDVCKGLDLVPATINLAGAEVELVNEMARENRLKAALGALRGKYDYIFIDCPPALGLLTVNALVASDKLLIPIQCEFYALEGVTKLLDSMKRVKTVLNPELDTFGVLLTMYDGRTMLSKQVAKEVRNFFGSQVFETIIPRTVRLSEAPSFGQPITEYDPTGRGAQAYNSLAKEVIERG